MDILSCYYIGMGKSKDIKQKILVGQHRRTWEWFGIVRESDGSQSKNYGPFKSAKHAEAVIRKVWGIPGEVETKMNPCTGITILLSIPVTLTAFDGWIHCFIIVIISIMSCSIAFKFKKKLDFYPMKSQKKAIPTETY